MPPGTLSLFQLSSQMSNSLNPLWFPKHSFIPLYLCLPLIVPRLESPSLHTPMQKEIQRIHESPAQMSHLCEALPGSPCQIQLLFHFCSHSNMYYRVICTSLSLTFLLFVCILFSFIGFLRSPLPFSYCLIKTKHSILNIKDKTYFPLSLGLDHNVSV